MYNLASSTHFSPGKILAIPDPILCVSTVEYNVSWRYLIYIYLVLHTLALCTLRGAPVTTQFENYVFTSCNDIV